MQTNEIVTNCQNHIFTVNVDNPDREKDNDGWCEVDECPSGVTDVNMLLNFMYTVKPLNINDKYINV